MSCEMSPTVGRAAHKLNLHWKNELNLPWRQWRPRSFVSHSPRHLCMCKRPHRFSAPFLGLFIIQKNEPRPFLSDEGSTSTPDHSSAVPPSQMCSHRLVRRVARRHKERRPPSLLPRLKSEFSTLLFNSLPTYILVVIIATNFNVISRLSTDPKCTDTGKHQWKEQFHYSNAHLAATFLQTQEFDGEAALFSYPAEDNKDVLRLEKKQKLFLFETCPILH